MQPSGSTRLVPPVDVEVHTTAPSSRAARSRYIPSSMPAVAVGPGTAGQRSPYCSRTSITESRPRRVKSASTTSPVGAEMTMRSMPSAL